MARRFQTDYFDEKGQILRIHPYQIALYLLLAGLTMLFFGISAAYLYTRIVNGLKPIPVPIVFVGNTLVLLASSLSLHWAKKCYLADNTRYYQIALGTTLCLTFLFIGLQLVGWQQLQNSGALLTSGAGTAYLYALSYLHLAHILGGLPFLILFFLTAIARMREPVSVLLYFSDPLKRLRLKLLHLYWHFLDALWIYLVLFFFINTLF